MFTSKCTKIRLAAGSARPAVGAYSGPPDLWLDLRGRDMGPKLGPQRGTGIIKGEIRGKGGGKDGREGNGGIMPHIVTPGSAAG